VETTSGGEMDHGCCRGEGALIAEKGERKRGAHRGLHKENTSPKSFIGKMGGQIFVNICNHWG